MTFSGEFYWPFLVIMVTPAIRLMLVGHWGQIMKDTVSDTIQVQLFETWKYFFSNSQWNHSGLLVKCQHLTGHQNLRDRFRSSLSKPHRRQQEWRLQDISIFPETWSPGLVIESIFIIIYYNFPLGFWCGKCRHLYPGKVWQNWENLFDGWKTIS